MGMSTLGTVSIAVKMPLYDVINTNVANNHVPASRRDPSVNGSHSLAAKNVHYINLSKIFYRFHFWALPLRGKVSTPKLTRQFL